MLAPSFYREWIMYTDYDRKLIDGWLDQILKSIRVNRNQLVGTTDDNSKILITDGATGSSYIIGIKKSKERRDDY